MTSSTFRCAYWSGGSSVAGSSGGVRHRGREKIRLVVVTKDLEYP